MRFSDLLGMYLSYCHGRGSIPGAIIFGVPALMWQMLWDERA